MRLGDNSQHTPLVLVALVLVVALLAAGYVLLVVPR